MEGSVTMAMHRMKIGLRVKKEGSDIEAVGTTVLVCGVTHFNPYQTGHSDHGVRAPEVSDMVSELRFP